MQKKEIMPQYRELLNRGFRAVQQRATQPRADREAHEKAIAEYETLFRIIDGMTPQEREWPIEIHFERMHAIAGEAGASDRVMLLFVMHFYNFANELGKAEFMSKRPPEGGSS